MLEGVSVTALGNLSAPEKAPFDDEGDDDDDDDDDIASLCARCSTTMRRSTGRYCQCLALKMIQLID